MSKPVWIGTWDNMNDLQRAGLKEKLGPEILREAEVILNRLPESERTEFACMACLDAAAKFVMERVRSAVRIELPQRCNNVECAGPSGHAGACYVAKRSGVTILPYRGEGPTSGQGNNSRGEG